MERYTVGNDAEMDELSDLEQTLNPIAGPQMDPAYYGQDPEDNEPDPEELLDGYIQALKALNYDNENIAYAANTTLERVISVVGEDGENE